MKHDKWGKEFLPGTTQIEKQERKERKQRELAKKAKKLGVTSAVSTVDFDLDFSDLDFSLLVADFHNAYFAGTPMRVKIPNPTAWSPRPIAEAIEELDGLMENHERLMGHFRS